MADELTECQATRQRISYINLYNSSTYIQAIVKEAFLTLIWVDAYEILFEEILAEETFSTLLLDFRK